MKLRLLGVISAAGLLVGVLPAAAPAAAPRSAKGPRHPAADHPHPVDLPADAEGSGGPTARRVMSRVRALATDVSPDRSPQLAPLSGGFHVPVLLVDFSDNPAEPDLHRPQDYQQMLFERDYQNGAGSLSDYYREQSGGLLEVTGEVTPSWMRLPRTYGAYTGSRFGYQTTEPNDWTLVRDAVDAADPAVDFCRADRDKNGLVDTMFVVHAGPGAEESGSGLWSLRWSLPGAHPTRDVCSDGRRMSVKQFTIEPEEYVRSTFSAPGAPDRLISIGVFVHEFGHALGLPDLYDTDHSSPGGVGTWDVMATGTYGFDGRTPWRPVPMSAWSKVALGWAAPKTISGDTSDVSFTSVDAPFSGQQQGVFKIVPAGTSGGEYFLIENRTREGWAAGFPLGGLAVWHVDSGATDNDNDGRRLVQMVQADGYGQLEAAGSSGRGDSGDLFPGSRAVRGIDQSTTPSTDLTGGRDSYVAIWSIGDAGAATSADIYLSPTSRPPLDTDSVVVDEVAVDEPVDGGDEDTQKVSAALTSLSDWPDPFTPNGDGRKDETNIRFWVTEEAAATVVIRRDGKRLLKLMEREIAPAGYRRITWDGTNRRGGLVRSGRYTYRITLTDATGAVLTAARGTTRVRR